MPKMAATPSFEIPRASFTSEEREILDNIRDNCFKQTMSLFTLFRTGALNREEKSYFIKNGKAL